MLAVLAIATPLQAQSDQSLILVFPECDARVNPPDNYTPCAAFSFGGLETLAVSASDGAGAETEVAPQASLSNPFVTIEKSWKARDSYSGLFSVLKPSAQSGEPHPKPRAEGNKPGKDFKRIVESNIAGS